MISIAVRNGFVVFIETDYSREYILLCAFSVSAIESMTFSVDYADVVLGIDCSTIKASLKQVLSSEDIDVRLVALENNRCLLIITGDAASQLKQALLQ